MPLLTDPYHPVPAQALAMPGPEWAENPAYGTRWRMVGFPAGVPIASGWPEPWNDSRHGYSRRQPWSSDMKLLYIEQRGGIPSKILLDGNTYQPILGSAGAGRVGRYLDAAHEVRWLNGPNMVGWLKGQQSLAKFNVLTDAVERTISVRQAVGWMGEGNVSRDHSVTVLANESELVLVDLLNARVGPLQRLTTGWPTDFLRINNATVSELSTHEGGRVIVKAGGLNGAQHCRIYDFDQHLHMTPRALDPRGLRMAGAKDASFAAQGLGACMSHADSGLTSDGREVYVGGLRLANDANVPADELKYRGRVYAMDIATGLGWFVDDPRGEAYDQHCSCRGPQGKVLVTYAGPHERPGHLCMELVLWDLLDGTCTRFGVTRTDESAFPKGSTESYRSEAHGCASPDGKRVIFASNGQHWTEPKPAPDRKSYVYEMIPEVPVDEPPVDIPPPVDQPPQTRFYVDHDWTYAPNGVVMDRGTGRLVPLETLAKWAEERL